MFRKRSWGSCWSGAEKISIRALVKVFINMIGVFPLGTLVLLNTNEMGIVIQTQEDVELLDRPKVCLLYYSDGEYRKGEDRRSPGSG